MSKKTISGHFGTAIALNHNNRDHIADNITVDLIPNDVFFVASGKPVSNNEKERYATLEEIYEKVFEPSWREYQSRQRKDRKSRYGSYLEELTAKRTEEDKKLEKLSGQKKHRHKTKATAYEIIWQIGNQDDANILKHKEDADKAGALLKKFSKHLLELPYVTVITTEDLRNPNWALPHAAGIIAFNVTHHADEANGCCHEHFDFIPYFKSTRGQSIQTGLGQTFAKLGFKSDYSEQLVNGERVVKKDKNGNVIRDKNNEIVYKKEVIGAGVYDWIEFQKQWIQKRMLEELGWERDYQGEKREHVDTPEYQAMRNLEKAEEAKKYAQMYKTMSQQEERIAKDKHEKNNQLESEIEQKTQILQTLDDICPIKSMDDLKNAEKQAKKDIECLFKMIEETDESVQKIKCELKNPYSEILNRLIEDFVWVWQKNFEIIKALFTRIREKLSHIKLFEIISEIPDAFRCSTNIEKTLKDAQARATTKLATNRRNMINEFEML